ncbi:PqqD family protein [Streptococcus gallolyticus]|uniref:PqqD family protein n=1 Tax=Streptococcus gallolyticus TaxID=315405 RepID=A0A368UES2_9STRE|nr:PqqD family peptide modification chaperone [Streptococcus gallolyticus]RCW17448.1 PqqD family protein [Streptococcus gallolyticus]
MKNHFIIKGKKDFVVDKVGDEYIGYDRIDLEYYSFDEIGAEILYCISKNFSLDKIIEVIQDEYDVNYADCKEAIINFLEETPILHIIYANLIKSDIYLYLKPFREE